MRDGVKRAANGGESPGALLLEEPTPRGHAVKISHERSKYMPHGGHRARCSCGWWSDCYAMHSDTERAVDVHLRRARRQDFEDLLARSSVEAIADVRRHGIDAHLVDFERAMKSRRRRRCDR